LAFSVCVFNCLCMSVHVCGEQTHTYTDTLKRRGEGGPSWTRPANPFCARRGNYALPMH
jgi:hypothetical protein